MSENAQTPSVSQEEINRKENELSNARSKLNRAESSRNALKAKLSRLEAAKVILDANDDDFEALKKNLKTTVDLKRVWKGKNQFNCIEVDGESMKNKINYAYNNIVNAALDDLNIAIRDVKNQIYEKEGLIGRLKSTINSLVTWLDNITNNYI